MASGKDITLRREYLAATVAPLIPLHEYDESNAKILHGFRELKDWIRVGFARETQKGTLFADLDAGLDHFIERIEQADEGTESLSFDADMVFKLKDGSCQIGEAQYKLGITAAIKARYEELRAEGSGLSYLFQNPIKPDERPNDSHVVYGYKLGIVKDSLEKLLDGLPVQIKTTGPQLKTPKP